MSVEVQNLSFRYGKTFVLKNINLRVTDGEVVSLVGPNGAGKSTLLKCINHIKKTFSGAIFVDGMELKSMQLNQISRMFGYVPQATAHSFPATVFDTVLLGRRPYLGWAVSPRCREIVYQTMISMELDHLALRQFNELSGGEQQRTLIARALVQEPKVLLLDEPTSNLDLRYQLEVLEHVAEIVKKRGISVIMAIHDLNLAAQYSDRIIFLKKGEVYRDGTPQETLVSATIKTVYNVVAMINNDAQRPYIGFIRQTSTRCCEGG